MLSPRTFAMGILLQFTTTIVSYADCTSCYSGGAGSTSCSISAGGSCSVTCSAGRYSCCSVDGCKCCIPSAGPAAMGSVNGVRETASTEKRRSTAAETYKGNVRVTTSTDGMWSFISVSPENPSLPLLAAFTVQYEHRNSRCTSTDEDGYFSFRVHW